MKTGIAVATFISLSLLLVACTKTPAPPVIEKSRTSTETGGERRETVTVSAINVDHYLPGADNEPRAVAYRAEVDGSVFVFSGDTGAFSPSPSHDRVFFARSRS